LNIIALVLSLDSISAEAETCRHRQIVDPAWDWDEHAGGSAVHASNAWL
jgi:hypothetical protein